MSNKYKMICGCEICILVKGMKNDLNAYMSILIRKFKSKKDKNAKAKAKTYKKSIYDNNGHLHEYPKKILLCIQCPSIENFNMTHMGCIL